MAVGVAILLDLGPREKYEYLLTYMSGIVSFQSFFLSE